MVSNTKNKFTAIGCDTFASIDGRNKGKSGHEHKYYTTCESYCADVESIDSSAGCSGMGCGQASIPINLRDFVITLSIDSPEDAADPSDDFSPCHYAFIVEDQDFTFNSSNAQADNFINENGKKVPMIVEWIVGNETCEQAAKKMESYACVAQNSRCADVGKVHGYICNCTEGSEGNPYLNSGCKDINECERSPQFPCKGKCKNTIGNYTCSCPFGTQSDDPKSMPCKVYFGTEIIGICVSIVFLFICIFALLIEIQRRKLEKEKQRFLRQNGGHILYKQITSGQVNTVEIFTEEVLKNATDNFDSSRELGTGGHGTVYKGILKDNNVVAVKRSRIINVTHAEEFVQEIIMLSQINHRNVVRLIGCCLEVEVPILVYEFISNGTLFPLIHGGSSSHVMWPVSLNLRLRIAQESAEALVYLHLSTNRPIIHGDMKSLNILLDDSYTVKVTDFSASRWLPKEAVQLMTMVQGTLGYLDPEYLQERKLTEKSDVYSFGVVLLELITGKTAMYHHDGDEEKDKSLAASFLRAMEEETVESILDASLTGASMEALPLLQEVAKLGSMCLSARGEERPSMAEVADRLKAVRGAWRELLVSSEYDVMEVFVDSSEAPPSGNPSSAMFWTADMQSLEVETLR